MQMIQNQLFCSRTFFGGNETSMLPIYTTGFVLVLVGYIQSYVMLVSVMIMDIIFVYCGEE